MAYGDRLIQQRLVAATLAVGASWAEVLAIQLS